jgi:cytochrome c-type biogenesis protein CcmH
MLLWIAIICLTLVTVLTVGRPLLRQQPVDAQPGSTEAGRRAVYADQLAEIEFDLGRGLIGTAEAEAARIEISRRLLAQAGSEPKNSDRKAAAAEPSSAIRTAIVVAIPLLALALYLRLGQPSLPGEPHAGSTVTATALPKAADIDKLIDQVEQRLRQAPEDGRGWDAIAPVYLKVQRYDEARAAFSRAIGLLGESSKRLIGLAESAIRANDGIVTDEARDAFAKVLTAEPGRLEARFWLALAREQHGETNQAAEEYRAILAAAAPDAPWRAAVSERLAAVSGGVALASKGPSAADVSAAQDMTPVARQQMIGGMIEGLHAKLRADGRDAAGWQKLLRSYAVLGDRDKAITVLSEARKALAGDIQGLGALDALAREIGLGS